MKARRIVFAMMFTVIAVSSSGELLRIVTEPTAGIIAPGTYSVSFCTFPEDGLRFSFSVGIISRLVLGMSYGGINVIGVEDAEWFDHLWLKGRFRLLDETDVSPALAFGYDNEPILIRPGLYSRKAKGMYVVISKNFSTFGGDMGVHGGVSLDPDAPEHAGMWIGFDKSVPGGFGIACEYDPAFNEPDSATVDEDGFLNAELYWESFGQVRISLQFIDIFQTSGKCYRAIGFDFLSLF